MASGLTLDSGALIAAEKQNRQFWVIWAAAMKREARVTVPSAVVAQTWRGNSSIIARLLNVCDVEVLDEDIAKRVGTLLAKGRGASDVVDAAVVVGAAQRGDTIVTSDPSDIGRLLEAAGGGVAILAV